MKISKNFKLYAVVWAILAVVFNVIVFVSPSEINGESKAEIDLEEDKTKLKLELKNQLTNNLEKELKLQTTLYGPHKDDFEFHLKEENLRFYGSQGQQRIAVLTIKLAEIEIIKNYKNEFPIVLLDDVFSELDNEKKNNLLSYINKDMQVIITTTDLENIDKQIINKAKLIHIKQGKMQKEVKK